MNNLSSLSRAIIMGATSLALVTTLQSQEPSQDPAKQDQPATKQGQPAKQSQRSKKVNAAKIQKMRKAPKLGPEELEKRYKEGLESPFIAKGNWVLDYDEARARAKREGKLIFVYFTRSYAY